ncbi:MULTISPECIES: hypothetical protein [Methanobacterium]|uniref:Tape measure domain-containing protein n=1 Tax=Methanobacterium veterum TaxID=408577 RepID=A0A9E4ZZT0_9EURY|nr:MULTISPECIES: hypothetical protein [Methanobacterium]MCZ3365390.1 hypothetical protein [Methanobacterium veterum]MCZ3373141.1 hypothetical protein [Methanobacterium veterum]
MGDNQYTIDISTTADSSSVEELAAKLQEVEQSAQRVTDALSDTDSSGLDSASDSASNAADNLERADEAANNFSNDVNNVDGGALENTANSADEASNSIDNASESASGLNAVATGLASAGIVATMMSWADSSGNASAQWARMGLAMKNTGMTAEQIQSTYGAVVSSISSDTGRSAGDIREFFIQMGISGVTNADVIKSSFEGIAGSAFLTGRNVDSLGEFFARLTKTGKLQSKQLSSQFGMGMNEVGAAMDKLGYKVGSNEKDIQDAFKNMDQTTRAKVLGTALALKGGQEANDDYKKSWDGVKQAMSKAEAGFFTFVGNLLIPTLIPAFQLATDGVNAVTSAFKSAPAPVQAVLGVVGTLGAGFIALVLAISTLKTVWGLLNITQTLSAIKSGVVTAATYAQTAATYVATAAQWAWNAAMSANPIAIIIILIVALVAVLLYLWSTNEGFRNAVIGIWNAISGAFIYAGQSIYGTLQWIWSGIVWFLGLIPQLPTLIGLYLAAAAFRFIAFAGTAVSNAINAGNRIISAIGSTLAALPGHMYQWGMNALSQFINGIINMIPGLSSALSVISNLFPHSPPKSGPLSTITAANMFKWASSIAYAGTLGFSTLNMEDIKTPNLSIGYGSASIGFDATEINASILENRESQPNIINYNDVTVNQDGIMSLGDAADFIIKAVVDQMNRENLITGKSG